MGVERYNDRMMKINIVTEDILCEVVSRYCPQAGRSVNEKEEFYELMEKVVTREVLVGGDFNSQVDSNVDGLERFMGGFQIGQINDGGIRLLDWSW